MFPCALWIGDRKALNAVSDGARRGHGCRASKVACFVDYNAIFSLDPATLLNTAKYYKR
jgi:hypothetical protein